MGESKESVTMRIPSAVRAELCQFAVRERRSLGNIGATLLEWAFEQLKTAGSTERLLQYKIRPSVKKVADNRAVRRKP
jgi:hypothetical protein